MWITTKKLFDSSLVKQILFLFCWALCKFVWSSASPRFLCHKKVWTRQGTDLSQRIHGCKEQSLDYFLNKEGILPIFANPLSYHSLVHPVQWSLTCSWGVLPSAGLGAKFQNGEKCWTAGYPEPVGEIRVLVLCVYIFFSMGYMLYFEKILSVTQFYSQS